MGKQTEIPGAQLAPRNAVLPPVNVRIEVFVDDASQLVRGWILAWEPPKILGTNSNDRQLARALLRFERWRESIQLSSPRARHAKARGVRLLLAETVVCAFAESEAIATLARNAHLMRKPVRLADDSNETDLPPRRARAGKRRASR